MITVDLHFLNLKMSNKVVNEWLGWDNLKKAPNKHVVTTRNCRTMGFVNMVGYCMKDIDEDHFRFV